MAKSWHTFFPNILLSYNCSGQARLESQRCTVSMQSARLKRDDDEQGFICLLLAETFPPEEMVT